MWKSKTFSNWFFDFNKRGAWNKRGGAKFGPFLVNVVAELTELWVKIFKKLIAMTSRLFGREQYMY